MANYREPQWLLPNEKNLAMPASDATVGSGLAEDRHSLYSMDFDGASYIDLTNSLDLGTNSTISFWFKSSSGNSNNTIIGEDTYTYDYLLQIASASNNAYIRIGSIVKTFTGITEINDGNWNNWCIARSGDSIELFINNTSKGVQTGYGTGTNTKFNVIGAEGDFQFPINGQLDEIAAWNRTLSTSEITTIYNSGAPGNLMALSDKPVAYWPLGEQARLGSEWQFPNEVLQSQVFDFDGSNDYIDCGQNRSLDTGDLSASIWINKDSAGSGTQYVFNNNNGSSIAGFVFAIKNSNEVFVGRSTRTKGAGSGWMNIGFIEDVWNNLVFSYNDTSGAFEVWFNGNSVHTSTATSSTNGASQNIIIGTNSGFTGLDFDGKLSNAVIWNSDQSANIANIYNNGSPQSSYTTTPTAWYKLNATSNYAGLNPNFHNALDFGATDYIDCGDGLGDSLGSYTGVITASTWVNPTLMSAGYGVFQIGDTGNGKFTLAFTSNNLYVYTAASSTATAQINGLSALIGKWNHIAIVWDTQDATNSKIYINGVATALSSGSFDTGTAALTGEATRLGYWYSTGYTFLGELSNIAFYTQEISAEDVLYLYNGGTPQTNISFEPVSWYKLDNLTTGIQDSGSASNNGTNNGATEVASNVAVDQWNFDNAVQSQTPNWSSALDFSGSNKWIDCGIDSSIDTGDLSVAFWFNKDSSVSGYQYVFNSGSGSARAGFVFAFSGTNIYVGRKTLTHTAGFTTYTNVGISADKWHHIALTYNDASNNFITYLDGQSVHTSTGTTATNAASSEIIFGRISNVASSYYKGKISNAAIFTSELDASAISTLYNSGQPETAISSSPLSWWKLDNTTTGIQDSGSASNNGTNNGATEIQTNVWTPRLNGESTTLPSTALVSSDLQFESPYSNFSLDFDGTNDYVDGNTASYLNATTTFTISTWFNTDTVAGTDKFLINIGGSSSELWGVQLYNGNLVVYGGSTSKNLQYNGLISINTWYSLALVYDGGQGAADRYKVYLNGVLLTPTTTVGTIDSVTPTFTNNLTIGKLAYSAAEYWNGKIDETAIWNTALTQAQVSQIYNNGYPADLTSLSPVSWWRLGEDAYFVSPNFTVPNQITGAPNGTSANMDQADLVADAPGSYASGIGSSLVVGDRVGDAPESTANSLSFNMTPLNKISYPSGYVPTQVDNVYSMAFDGTNDYVNLGSPSELNLTGEMSAFAWIKTNSLSGTDGVVMDLSSGGTQAQWGLEINRTAAKVSVLGNGSGAILTGNTSLTTGTWFHIGFTRSGTASNWTYTIYVNGVSDGTITTTTNPDAQQGAAIGRLGSYNGGYFNGEIDEVAIFNYPLSARQIKQDIYNGTTTGKTADLNNISNLTAPVAWYRMGD